MFKQNKNLKIYFLVFLSIFPFLTLFFQSNVLDSSKSNIANIFGLIGTVLFLWQITLGNRFIVKYFTQDYARIVKLHIFLGINGLFFTLTHPILETFVYKESLSFMLVPKLNTSFNFFIALGVISLYLYLALWLSSAVIRNKISFRLWQYIHYIGYIIPLFVFIHALKIGSFLSALPLFKLYWIFLFAIYLLFLLFKVLQVFGFSSKKYIFSNHKQKK